MTHSYPLAPNSIQTYRYRVESLAQELWREKNQLKRMNIALQLADAATHLSRLEAEELQKKHSLEFNELLKEEMLQNRDLAHQS